MQKNYESIITLIQGKLNVFSESEKMIAEYIIKYPELIKNHSIDSLSKELFISKPTISRFCKKLEFNGFRELKFIFNSIKSSENETNTLLTTEELFNRDYLKILQRLNSIIDEKSLTKFVNLCEKANQIYILGIGTSGFLAEDFAIRLKRIGFNAQAITSSHFMLMQTRLSTSKDIIIAISRSGDSVEIVNSISNARKNNTKVILITEYFSSKATKSSNLVILSPQKHGLYLIDSISDQLTMLLITDRLYNYLLESNKEKYIYNLAKTVILEKNN